MTTQPTTETAAAEALLPRLTAHALELVRRYNGSGWGEAMMPIQSQEGQWFARDLSFDTEGAFTGMTLRPLTAEQSAMVARSVAAKAAFIASGQMEACIEWPTTGPFAS